ncbi:hypothetical protein B0H16DRAFT_1461318 [Mycena metata]|uniref:Uncharacterized protein n=1 Tax=Mycena metata TaxID=1033252 RepID=A0AAD7IUU9_9AGAR|nr:hypothetical protein B0H16DRAFT_1461318 [Mycena metata]
MVNGHRKKGPRATQMLLHSFPSSQPINYLSGPTRINEENSANGRWNIASAIWPPQSKVATDHYSGDHRTSRNKGFSWRNAGWFLLLLINMAAVKAKKWQWDPPRKARQPEAPASASSAVPDDQPDNRAIDPGTPLISLTAPEHFALETLLELSQPALSLTEATRTPEAPEILDNKDRPVESGILGDWENVFAKELPFYVRPASSAQKKIQHELGVIGPLTGTQQMRIAAAALGNPFDGSLPELDVVIEPSLNQQHWDRILEWRDTKFDNPWDAETLRGFAEAVLCRFYRR